MDDMLLCAECHSYADKLITGKDGVTKCWLCDDETKLAYRELGKLTGDVDIDFALLECLNVLKVKGQDYAKEADRLSNFKEVACQMGLSPRQVLGVLMSKHIIALQRYCREGRLESEPIESRIVDVINYALLLYKMVKCEKRA